MYHVWKLSRPVRARLIWQGCCRTRNRRKTQERKARETSWCYCTGNDGKIANHFFRTLAYTEACKQLLLFFPRIVRELSFLRARARARRVVLECTGGGGFSFEAPSLFFFCSRERELRLTVKSEKNSYGSVKASSNGRRCRRLHFISWVSGCKWKIAGWPQISRAYSENVTKTRRFFWKTN